MGAQLAAEQVQVVDDLRRRTLEGPVFGPGVAFHRVKSQEIGEPLTEDQLETRLAGEREHLLRAAAVLTATIEGSLGETFPDIPQKMRTKMIKYAISKVICFVYAITNRGELPENLEEFGPEMMAPALSVFGMYGSNTPLDGGDKGMYWALVEKRRKRAKDAPDSKEKAERIAAIPATPQEHKAGAENRTILLDFIPAKIAEHAAEDDVPTLRYLFMEAVLDNELSLFDIAAEFYGLPEGDQDAFLTANADRLADLMVDCAGFPSVSLSHYSRFRRFVNPSLPSVDEIRAAPGRLRLEKMENTFARVLDEMGDALGDGAGKVGAGPKTINPFNQYNYVLVDALCERGGIPEDEREAVQDAFKHFRNNRELHGKTVATAFTKAVRNKVLDLFETLPPEHKVSLRFDMRVLEISKVNEVGDDEMAGSQ